MKKLAVVVILWCSAAHADGRDRLVALGKLWGFIKFHHPAVVERDLDWDAPLLDAIPRVEAAHTSEEYRAAVQSMLAPLHDPITIAKREKTAPSPAPALASSSGLPTAAAKPAPISWPDKETLLVRIGDSGDAPWELMEKLAGELPKAKKVIFDLRATSDDGGGTWAVDNSARMLVSRELHARAIRTLQHSGYASQGGASGGYHSDLVTELPAVWMPRKDAKPHRYAFIVNENSGLPSVAAALQAAGDALLISIGPLDDGALVPTRGVPLGEGLVANVRMGELVGPPIRADLIIPVDAPAAVAVDRARSLLAAPPRKIKPQPTAQAMTEPVRRPDKKYEDAPYPARPLRLLALFRIWNIIEIFYPYRRLLDEDWSEILPRYVSRFADARDARDYTMAVLELAGHIQDDHIGVWGSKELDQILGSAMPPFVIRYIESQPTVIAIHDEPTRKLLGIGDVILAVDGTPVSELRKRLVPITPASTPQGLELRLSDRLLAGADGSTVSLRVRGAAGEKTVQVSRKLDWARAPEPRPGEVVRILDGNFGYIDLARLEPGEVDGAFEKLKTTRGLVFDLRGYPHGTGWTITPRINVKKAKIGALFRRNLVGAGSGDESNTSFLFEQPMPTGKNWIYDRPIVTMIDERAVSQSEHTALFFEQASGCKFIGSPTTGANGDVTVLSVPGGMAMSFTGHDVRHADGRQLQRVGIQPDIAIKPTIAGLRAGKDEVLDRAIRYLTAGK